MQLELFELYKPHFKTDLPIRLIELFGGIGSQAMALKRLNAPYSHWKLIEYNKYPVASYNEIHGTTFVPMDITKVHAEDLEIVDVDKYTYIMTYSFPCQDLSIAGKRKGMSRGTRSGLLWEVERILKECENLPQVLIMENVTMVHSEDNRDDFRDWIDFLSELGYSNYYQDLNSKDYGSPQQRERCFMVSILGDYYYKFPKPIPVKKKVKDFLDEEVEDKFYMKNSKAKDLIEELADEKIFTKPCKRLRLLGCMDCSDGTLEKDNRVYDMNGLAATVTCGSASVQGKYLDIKPTEKDGDFVHEIKGQKYLLRVRKITPIECWRLMGFSEEDYHKAEKVNSLTQVQKQAGNSIVVNCLVGIFSQLNIAEIPMWNDLTEDEIYDLISID